MGSLTIIVGPMFAGKSTQLLREKERYEFSKKKYKLLTISHIFDEERTEQKIVKTHSELSCDADLMLSSLLSVLEMKEYDEADAIFIDEGQFFNDIYDFCLESQKKEKNVFVSFLSGTFERKAFGNTAKLYPIATNIIHIKAICSFCELPTEAPFTIKIGDKKEIIDIGAGEKYIPVCLKHYLEKNIK